MHRLSITCFVVAFTGMALPAWAQGYSVYQQGTCEMGRASAGVAAPCDDGSAIFFNPAGLATTRTPVLTIGATAVPPRGTFTNNTTGNISTLNASTSVVPAMYFAHPLGKRFAIGIGMFAPYGLATDWPATSEGRFIGYFSSVKSIYVQPTAAMQLTDCIRIGAGLDITRVSVELKNRLDLASVPLPGAAGLTFSALGVPARTDFADLDLTGNALSVGGHFGVLVNASGHVSIGARYLTRQTSQINNGQLATKQISTGLASRAALPGLPAGTPLDRLVAPQFAPGQALGAQSATTSLPLPDQLVIGTAIRAGNKLTLLADYQFTDWSLFDSIDIHNQVAPETRLPQGYRNTHGIRLGFEYEVKPSLTLRSGFDAYTAGAPDQSVTPIIPDAPRREYSAGATIRVNSRSAFDVAYQFINQQDRNGRTGDVNDGIYHIYANMLALSWSIRF